jgi:hypothetical protein
MLKVQQTKQNECFLKEAGDYLVANGYTTSVSQFNGSIKFVKDDKTVMVFGDNIDFLTWDGDRKPRLKLYMAVTNIADLDIFKWMLLFHIADVVPLKQFLNEAKKECLDDVQGFSVQIFDHFRVVDNHNAVPVNY